MYEDIFTVSIFKTTKDRTYNATTFEFIMKSNRFKKIYIFGTEINTPEIHVHTLSMN